MSAYQGVGYNYMTDIPTQALLTLENGRTVMSDVEWEWTGYDKDSEFDQIVYGTLKNLPAAAQQPAGKDVLATLIVNITKAQYTVTNVANTSYTGSTCLTLEELNQTLHPTLLLTLESQGEDSTRTVMYDLPVTFEGGTPSFDPKEAKEYTFNEPFTLADNITWPESIPKAVTLTTEKVEITDVNSVSVPVSDGTAFADVPLPNQVLVTLSCVDPSGENKKLLIDVTWTAPENYTPNPESWGEDGTVVFTANGVLPESCSKYISNVGSTTVSAQITMLFVPTLVAIDPNPFPNNDILIVPLGSTLDEIYAKLETPKVQLTLLDHLGATHTLEVSFELRKQDNSEYDPLNPQTGEYYLNAHLLLDEEIKNPNNLGLQVKIETVKYTITAFQAISLKCPVGTAFEDLGLPAEVLVRRDDNGSEYVGVTWDDSTYDPTTAGFYRIQGTLQTPLPLHLDNPRNRQPRASVTLSEPNAHILSLTPVDEAQIPATLAEEWDDGTEDWGFTEYFYWAEVLHEDGHISTEMVSILVEDSSVSEER